MEHDIANRQEAPTRIPKPPRLAVERFIFGCANRIVLRCGCWVHPVGMPDRSGEVDGDPCCSFCLRRQSCDTAVSGWTVALRPQIAGTPTYHFDSRSV